VRATVVDVLIERESSWLLVDIIDGTVQGLARVIVEVEGSRVDCDGVPAPTYLLTDGEEVSFVVAPSVAARPDPPDLRWTASVAVVGGDIRMSCASSAELAATLDAQRDRWEAAGMADYEFTLRWVEFSDLGGDYRVTVIDGRPGSIVRLTEPLAGPDAATIDLTRLPATIDEVFDFVEADLDAERVVACYDAELGYPVDVLIDRILNAIDDETAIAITELTVAGGTADRSLGVENLEAFEHRRHVAVELDADGRQVAAEERLVVLEPGLARTVTLAFVPGEGVVDRRQRTDPHLSRPQHRAGPAPTIGGDRQAARHR
jgi:hypothetical protein